MNIRLFILFIVFSALQTSVCSQSSPSGRNQVQKEKIDEAKLCLTYTATRTIDTVSLKRYQDMRRFEVGSNVSRDYSIYADKSDSIAFEVYKKNAYAGADLYSWLEPDQRGFCEDYYYNYPQKGVLLNSFFIVNAEYRYSEPLPVFKWDTKFSETQTILGFICQKATADFRGRKWTVWYTTEIPVNHGPWKFSGLPGMILKAYDNDHFFEFTAVGIEKGRNSPIFIYDSNAPNATQYNQNKMKIVNTTRDKIRSLQVLFWKDPVYLNELHGVAMAIRDKSGKTVIQKSGSVQNPYLPPLELQ